MNSGSKCKNWSLLTTHNFLEAIFHLTSKSTLFLNWSVVGVYFPPKCNAYIAEVLHLCYHSRNRHTFKNQREFLILHQHISCLQPNNRIHHCSAKKKVDLHSPPPRVKFLTFESHFCHLQSKEQGKPLCKVIVRMKDNANR